VAVGDGGEFEIFVESFHNAATNRIAVILNASDEDA
jgi:hypothetical protein